MTIRPYLEARVDPMIVLGQHFVVESLLAVARVHADGDGGVLEADIESLQDVAQVDGPGALAEALLLDELVEVGEHELPVRLLDDHEAAGEAAVPVVALLVVLNLVQLVKILKREIVLKLYISVQILTYVVTTPKINTHLLLSDSLRTRAWCPFLQLPSPRHHISIVTNLLTKYLQSE